MGCTASVPAGSVAAVSHSTEKRGLLFTEYQLGSKLGKGGFAQVRSATQLKTGSDLAVKIQDLTKNTNPTNARRTFDLAIKQVLIEENVWRKAGSHPNIVGFVGAYMHNGLSFFVMEKCDSSLLVHLERGAGAAELNEQSLGQVFWQVLSAVAHIHAMGAVHRDIKPGNLLAQHGVVKMCDFGLGEICDERKSLTEPCGTAPFMAPEILRCKKYGQKVDNWSVGVMAYVLLFGEFPYTPTERNSAAMRQVIRDGKPEPRFKPQRRTGPNGPRASGTATQFVRALLHRDADERPCAKDALQMAYIKDLEVAPSQQLPCMRPMLAGALKAGAFENRRVNSRDALDDVLGQLQLKYLGRSLEGRWQVAGAAETRSRDALKREKRATVSSAGTSITASPASVSNVWESDSHTTSTTLPSSVQAAL